MGHRKLAVGVVLFACFVASEPALAVIGAGKLITNCGATSPLPLQVFVYSSTNYNGSCWALELEDDTTRLSYNIDWAGYDATEGFPNDTVRSVKVGSSVRLRMFWNCFYDHDEGGGTGGAPFTTEVNVSDLGSPWNGNASAARVELRSQDRHCGNPAHGNFIVLWDDPTYPSPDDDCTILSGLGNYYSALWMAYRNDNASAFWTDTPNRYFYNNANLSSWMFRTGTSGGGSCGNLSGLPACGYTVALGNATTANANNQISSVGD